MDPMDPVSSLWSALSHPRLDLGFRASAAESERTVLARYLYNLALCEALYPVLHTLEIALRNSLDAVLSAEYPPGRAAPHVVDGLRAVADLRNQVFHHRPIWREPLGALHAGATDAIGWMRPQLQQVTRAADRFPDVCRKGVAGYEKDLAAFLALQAQHGHRAADGTDRAHP